MKKPYSFAVIGAGPAGMTAALVAAKAGKSVILIDHMPQPARKLLMTGGGKCNFSNRHISPGRYLSNNPHFCKSALAGLTTKDILACFSKNGIEYTEKEDGKLFLTSSFVLYDFFKRSLQSAQVDFAFGNAVRRLRTGTDGFYIDIGAEIVTARHVLIATGGLSYPSTGASGFAFDTARQFGLNCIETAPALSPMIFPDAMSVDFSNLQGISAPVRIKTNGKTVNGSALWTHDGLSGPAVLQASLYWKPDMPVLINFMPETSLFEVLKAAKTDRKQQRIMSFLSPALPKRLAESFIKTLPLEKRNAHIVEIADKELNRLASHVNAFSFVPKRIDGYRKAEVTRGGIDTNELSSKTMESKKVKNLFFAGECVDVTGEVGGFNLHWAFASGTSVGRYIAAKD